MNPFSSCSNEAIWEQTWVIALFLDLLDSIPLCCKFNVNNISIAQTWLFNHKVCFYPLLAFCCCFFAMPVVFCHISIFFHIKAVMYICQKCHTFYVLLYLTLYANLTEWTICPCKMMIYALTWEGKHLGVHPASASIHTQFALFSSTFYYQRTSLSVWKTCLFTFFPRVNREDRYHFYFCLLNMKLQPKAA